MRYVETMVVLLIINVALMSIAGWMFGAVSRRGWQIVVASICSSAVLCWTSHPEADRVISAWYGVYLYFAFSFAGVFPLVVPLILSVIVVGPCVAFFCAARLRARVLSRTKPT